MFVITTIAGGIICDSQQQTRSKYLLVFDTRLNLENAATSKLQSSLQFVVLLQGMTLSEKQVTRFHSFHSQSRSLIKNKEIKQLPTNNHGL